MAHQRCSDPLPLVSVDDDEGHLRLSGLHDDVTAAADDDAATVFLQNGDQGHVGDEVDIHKVRDLLFRKVMLWRKEAAVERLSAGSAYGCEEAVSVIRSQR